MIIGPITWRPRRLGPLAVEAPQRNHPGVNAKGSHISQERREQGVYIKTNKETSPDQSGINQRSIRIPLIDSLINNAFPIKAFSQERKVRRSQGSQSDQLRITIRSAKSVEIKISHSTKYGKISSDHPLPV